MRRAGLCVLARVRLANSSVVPVLALILLLYSSTFCLDTMLIDNVKPLKMISLSFYIYLFPHIKTMCLTLT